MTKEMQNLLDKDCRRIGDAEAEKVYRNCFGCTWDTTLQRQKDGKSGCSGRRTREWLIPETTGFLWHPGSM